MYFPPNSPTELYQTHIDFIDQIAAKLKPNILLSNGAYNLPRLQWTLDPDENFLFASNVSSSSEVSINDGMLGVGLHQINHLCNRNKRQLDLVFTNSWDQIIVAPTEPLIKNESHHDAISITISGLGEDESIPNIKKLLNYKKCNFDLISKELAKINWNEMLIMSKHQFLEYHQQLLHVDLYLWFEDLQEYSMESKVDVSLWIFYVILGSAIIRHTPTITRNLSSSSPPWFDKDLTKLRRRKNELHKKASTGSLKAKHEFNHIRKEFKALNELKYKLHVENISDELKSSPKSFFDFVNTKKKSKKFPSSMSYKSVTSSDATDIANMFASFFHSVYEPSSLNRLPEAPANTRLDFNSLSFSPTAVMDGITKMNLAKGPGPDGIPPSFINDVAASICVPLSLIFNESLSSGIFPLLWKISHVTPIFKKGDKGEVENYRSVVIQKSMAKLFDMLVFDTIRPALARQLNEKQHGFMAGKSTASNLVLYATELINAVEQGHEIDVVNTDFSKAFDKVSHQILLTKLHRFGFGCSMVDWLGSYLRDRRQFVLFDGEKSQTFDVTSGVPAGTHGGPDLFLVMIDDLPDVLDQAKISMYADDCKLFMCVADTSDQELLQRDIRNFDDWCQQNLHGQRG